jgi:hypothetical protein
MEKIELKTGTLTLESNDKLNELIGFTSRANNKRGFLFVSKVLGKHIPCKPGEMEKVHKELAGILKPLLKNKPTVVIGFAETATGIGNGVYSQLGMENSFYIHTSRYKLSAPVLLEFQEEHCHAPSHILYDLVDEKLKNILQDAGNIVLVDDEITTGKTLLNIISKLKEKFPRIKNYFAVSILNWARELPEHIKFISLYSGNFSFTEKLFEIGSPSVSVTAENSYLDEFIPFNFGRFGIKDLQLNFENYLDTSDLTGKKVLVLGTGEFMHQSYLLGKYLEDNGVDVYVQSTTRSPINIDRDIQSKLEFKDNYHENIDNFVYNVIDKSYDKVFICYETASLPKNHNLKSLLENYFSDVEELFLQTTGI